ncbi:hypothetical protein Hte_002267 [Hypoxylon texense]
MKEILDLANKLNDLITKQEAKAETRARFRTFAHSFAKGPKEQKQPEKLKGDHTTQEHARAVYSSWSCPLWNSTGRKRRHDGWVAIMQGSRIIREPEDKDFDRITIRDVDMKGASLMNNSAVTPDQQKWVLNEQS